MSGPSGASLSSNGDDGQSQTQMPPPGVQPPPTGTAGARDPASSLRAAALLTLKSKRKKLPSDSDTPATLGPRTRMSARSTIHLDYGQDDSSSTTAPPPQSNSLATISSNVASPVSPQEIDDSQTREEGEISDSEAAAATKSQPPVKKDIKKLKQSDSKTSITEPSSFTMAEPPKSDRTVINIKTEPATPRLRTAPVSPSIPSTPPRQNPKPERPEPGESSTSFIIDENHVRPGLALNQEQYDTAKDIVLDLLGWGVSPDYLVDCGLSRELVFYVFTELRLRFPTNLDTTNIPPYTPELLQSVYEGRIPSTQGSLPIGKAVSRPQPFSHLPLKQNASQGIASSSTYSSLSPIAVPFQPSSQHDNGPSLHDIEQQRRRELLARKAVVASRKNKHIPTRRTPSPSPSPTASSVNEPIKDVEMVPAETVDDFLNSIGPVDDQTHQTVNQTSTLIDTDRDTDPPPRASTPSGMDIDEIPGLATSEGSGVWFGLSSSLTFSSLETSSASNDHGRSVLAGEPSSADSMQSVMSFASHHSDMKSNNSDSITLNGDDASIAPRRGTKRPVAADFVEYDGDQVLVSNGNVNHVGPPFSKRKLGSFASVSGMRRCVIDLSDSEDDGFEDNGLYRHSIHSPYSIPTRQASWLASIGSTVTPPIGTQVPPAALLEKEQEIKRMREMIAQREQNRLRKLVMSSRNTPLESLTSMSTPGIEVDTPFALPDQPTQKTPPPVDRMDIELPSAVNVNGHRYSGKETPVADDFPASKATSSSVVSISAEGSSSTTPIDIASKEFELPITGNQVLIDEAQQEEVVDTAAYEEISSEDQESVEVDGVAGFETSSTQEEERLQQDAKDPEATHDRWTTYHSILESYPLLHWHSQIAADTAIPVSEFASSNVTRTTMSTIRGPLIASSTSMLPLTASWPDLKAFKTSVACKAFDAERRVCQYEVPGGGECRDAQCEDIHISRASVMEPGDDDTAQYLHDTLPDGLSGQDKPSVKVIKDALEDVRRKKGMTMIFDDRVTMALSMLGLR